MPDRSYSTRQLAEQLGVSVQTVQRWVDAGHLKAWKTMGGHRRIDAESADAWVRSRGLLAEQVDAPEECRLSVLAVDDDPNFLTLIEMLVVSAVHGASVDKAHNGFDALQRLARATPHLLVTDVVMPHVDGIEMLRHVCAQPHRPPVIVVTSALQRIEVEERGELPAGVLFMRKPLDQPAFLALLHRCAAEIRAA